MSRRYDSRTTIFSPEGRLYQVEYAMEAISHAGTCLGILAGSPTNGGIVLIAEKKVTSKLLEQSISHEKIYPISSDIAACVAGITSDANILIQYARNSVASYFSVYQEPKPVEQLVQTMCDLKQGYTQNGGLRPFGVSFLYGGWDRVHGFQLYQSDPSGNYGGWKATCIGASNAAAQSMLKSEYKEDLTLKEAIDLALKVLSKTMDGTSLTAEKLELATIFLQPVVKNTQSGPGVTAGAATEVVEKKTHIKLWKESEIEPLLKATLEANAAAAAAANASTSRA